jgi:histone acetyltransferase (RNA polymerase elongator complex component)
MPLALSIPHPAPPRSGRKLVPVFLPYAGCPGRCVYCAQPLATGAAAAGDLLARAWESLARDLEDARSKGDSFELGFFGGTFTALPGDWTERFLDLAAAHRDPGPVRAVRCSTRPDAVDPGRLARLRDRGLDLVELGVQSFDADCLASSGRGYGREQALAACAAVREAGLGLGIQLLPGLPDMAPDPAGPLASDVALALEQAPAVMRLYPCVVLEGTGLARRWAAGEYVPWTVAQAVDLLGRVLLACWRAGVPVIRQGLSPQPGLDRHILAGPWHPALGQMARSRALFAHLAGNLAEAKRRPARLLVPRAALSDILGHGREMLPAWAGLGLTEDCIRVWDHAAFGFAY